jgi:pyridoxine/pyridoxamine 5'-phosphate oxidase
MQRQVTVLGEVTRVEDSLAEEYFQSRPYLSRIGAWASSKASRWIPANPWRNPFWQLRKNWGKSPQASSLGRVLPAPPQY